MMGWNKKRRFLLAVSFLAAVSVLCVEIFFAKRLKATELGNTFYEIIIRGIGIAVFASFIIMLGYGNIFKPFRGKSIKDRLFLLPCFAIAINNFPFVSVIGGDAYISFEFTEMLLYACLCLFVGGFEEIAFRGFLFMLFLGKREKTTVSAFFAILFSSAVFGLIHIVNLFGGAGLGSVILQIGYSTLIGALASVVLLKTKNIWYCIALHALYNFCGGIVPSFGGGKIWTVGEVVLTSVVSVTVAIYVIYEFVKIPNEDISRLFDGQKDR